MNVDYLKAKIELSIKELVNDEYEVVLLPKNNIHEAFAIIDNLKDELLCKSFAKLVSDLINENKELINQEMLDNDEGEFEVPHFVKVEFEEEWNDGNSTYTTISSLYFYNKDGEYINTPDICFTPVDYDYPVEFDEFIREEIYEMFSLRELESAIDEYKVKLYVEGE